MQFFSQEHPHNKGTKQGSGRVCGQIGKRGNTVWNHCLMELVERAGEYGYTYYCEGGL